VPLAAIRTDGAAAWAQRARADQVGALAERIAAEAGRQPLAAAGAAHHLPPPQALAIRRLELTQMAQQGKQIPPPVVRMLSTPAGAARTVPAPGGQGWFVVAVAAVEPGNVAEMPQLTGAVLQGMQRAAGDEMVASLLQAVEREAGVVRRPEAIRAVNQRLGGVGAP
jgi:peptidyl-prolyl cis-trans isomerase D